jgi:hypothetical protein
MAMSELAIYLSGIPCIERDGRAVALERHKALALLAYLAVTGVPHRRDALYQAIATAPGGWPTGWRVNMMPPKHD